MYALHPIHGKIVAFGATAVPVAVRPRATCVTKEQRAVLVSQCAGSKEQVRGLGLSMPTTFGRPVGAKPKPKAKKSAPLTSQERQAAAIRAKSRYGPEHPCTLKELPTCPPRPLVRLSAPKPKPLPKPRIVMQAPKPKPKPMAPPPRVDPCTRKPTTADLQKLQRTLNAYLKGFGYVAIPVTGRLDWATCGALKTAKAESTSKGRPLTAALSPHWMSCDWAKRMCSRSVAPKKRVAPKAAPVQTKESAPAPVFAPPAVIAPAPMQEQKRPEPTDLPQPAVPSAEEVTEVDVPEVEEEYDEAGMTGAATWGIWALVAAVAAGGIYYATRKKR